MASTVAVIMTIAVATMAVVMPITMTSVTVVMAVTTVTVAVSTSTMFASVSVMMVISSRLIVDMRLGVSVSVDDLGFVVMMMYEGLGHKMLVVVVLVENLIWMVLVLMLGLCDNSLVVVMLNHDFRLIILVMMFWICCYRLYRVVLVEYLRFMMHVSIRMCHHGLVVVLGLVMLRLMLIHWCVLNNHRFVLIVFVGDLRLRMRHRLRLLLMTVSMPYMHWLTYVMYLLRLHGLMYWLTDVVHWLADVLHGLHDMMHWLTNLMTAVMHHYWLRLRLTNLISTLMSTVTHNMALSRHHYMMAALAITAVVEAWAIAMRTSLTAKATIRSPTLSR